jgi:hypothetical protein
VEDRRFSRVDLMRLGIVEERRFSAALSEL